MNNFEIYPKTCKNNPNIYGLYVVVGESVDEIATYDIFNDELVIKDVVVNSQKMSFNKVMKDFIKECNRLEELKEYAKENC